MQRVLLTVLALLALLAFAPTAAPAQRLTDTFVLSVKFQKTNCWAPALGCVHEVNHWTWCGDCIGIDFTTKEPWVVNPTSCMWDQDDSYSYLYNGTSLPASASTSVNECDYTGNGLANTTDMLIHSSSPSLIVTTTFRWKPAAGSSGVASATVPAVYNSETGLYDYRGCISEAYISINNAIAEEVPGSHGGVAFASQVTQTLTNPTTHKVAKTSGQAGFGDSLEMAGCAYGEFVSPS
jgi:hypothetical protein